MKQFFRFFRFLVLSSKVRQKLNKEADMQRRELDVVLKIAKLCGYKVFFYNDAMKKLKKVNNASIIRYVDQHSNSYLELDVTHPYYGYYYRGLKDHARDIPWVYHPETYKFPTWLKDASLEEAEFRLAIMGVEV